MFISTVCESGTSAAPNKPCMTRNSTICTRDCEKPHRIEATVKPTTETRKRRFSPNLPGLSRDRGDQAAFANCGHGGEIGLNTRPSPAPNIAVVHRAADLKKQIGASPRPSHLLRFIHSPVDQEIRGTFGN